MHSMFKSYFEVCPPQEKSVCGFNEFTFSASGSLLALTFKGVYVF